jgi:hypothetical protein
MPEIYKQSDSIKAYRAYYNGDKQHLFHWTKRDIPYWIKKLQDSKLVTVKSLVDG